MSTLDSKYRVVRSLTRSLAESLSAEDQMIQSCPEASPVKWHQAHTTWFFETFVLRPFLPDYRPFREGSTVSSTVITSDSARKFPTRSFGHHFLVHHSMRLWLSALTLTRKWKDCLRTRWMERYRRRIILGLNHEQQHHELILTDIKHAFFSNPLRPSYRVAALPKESTHSAPKLRWLHFEGGLTEIGYSPHAEDRLGFCFDHETPRHRVYLEPFQMANRNVTCREYLEFMSDDGYTRPGLWLSDGWEIVKLAGWEAPLYWDRDSADETGWRVFTLRGWHGLSELLDTAVCHISFFEADALARWRGCRLPTETEWESVAAG